MLRIHETEVELVREGVMVAPQIERHDPDLARQLRRALTSVPLNIAEGSVQTGKRRAPHYRIAMKSAMMVADAAGYTGPIAEQISAAFRAVIGTMHRCVVSASQAPARRAARPTPRRPPSVAGLLLNHRVIRALILSSDRVTRNDVAGHLHMSNIVAPTCNDVARCREA